MMPATQTDPVVLEMLAAFADAQDATAALRRLRERREARERGAPAPESHRGPLPSNH